MKLHPKQQHIVDVYGKLPETLDEIAEAVIAVVSVTDPVIGFAWNIHYEKSVSNTHRAPVHGEINWSGRDPDAPRGYPGFYGRFWIRYAKDPDFSWWSEVIGKSLTHTGSGGGGAYDGPWTEICSAVYKAKNYLPDNGDLFSPAIPRVHCYSTDYTFYIDDFPGLGIAEQVAAFEEQQDKDEVWAKVNGTRFNRLRFNLAHQYHWEDPATWAADKEFIKILEELRQGEPA
jgi:hypothetical protein